MTKRQIARLAFDDEHRRLMLRADKAPPGQRLARRRELEAYVSQCLRTARRRRRRT